MKRIPLTANSVPCYDMTVKPTVLVGIGVATMKVSTRGEYGLRALLDLAQHYGTGPIPLRQIAERQRISEHYLEQLMGGLRKAGFVVSVRGAHGGYALARTPEEIVIGDVLRVLEGSSAIEFDNGGPLGSEPDDLARHGTRYLWGRLEEQVASLLDGLCLARLLNHARSEQATHAAYVYHI